MGLLSELGAELSRLDKGVERMRREKILTLDACIHAAYEMRKEYPQITGFLLAVKDLGLREDNGYEITVAYLDKNRKAITLDGRNTLADIHRVNSLDEKLLNLLDGSKNAVYEL